MTSPALVLLSGLASGALATVLAFPGVVVPIDELSRVVAVAVLASAGATSMSVWQRWVHQKASQSLDAFRHDANHDALTGLANRAELYRQLEETVIQARADRTVFGVLFLDLDRFKVINDSMGHDAGDELLKAVAERLQATTRTGDVVARLGGDEFVVICRGLLSEESVVAVAQQILRRFTEPVSLKGRAHQVSTSVGVAVATGSEERDAEALVRDADAAMYVAKRNRSGIAVFDDAHRSYITDRLDTERDLRRALEEEQLLVYYQPIVDVGTDRLYGFEALVRWNHPRRGLLAPSEFLSVAEDARLLSEVGEVVLREACAQAAVWNHLCPEARTIRIGVNVSEQQLADPQLPELIKEILAWSGLGADQLVLEITEDVIVEHLGGLTVLRELRDLGVSLAIDDFGTGQSSLSYVKQFDMVSTLKIDQSFVRDMHVGAADLAIIDAVVAMSTALDLRVVAEGVERDDQIEVLADLGIRLMQGFYFNAPLAPEELDDPRNWFEAGPLSNPGGLKPLTISRSFASGQLPTPRAGLR